MGVWGGACHPHFPVAGATLRTTGPVPIGNPPHSGSPFGSTHVGPWRPGRTGCWAGCQPLWPSPIAAPRPPSFHPPPSMIWPKEGFESEWLSWDRIWGSQTPHPSGQSPASPGTCHPAALFWVWEPLTPGPPTCRLTLPCPLCLLSGSPSWETLGPASVFHPPPSAGPGDLRTGGFSCSQSPFSCLLLSKSSEKLESEVDQVLKVAKRVSCQFRRDPHSSSQRPSQGLAVICIYRGELSHGLRDQDQGPDPGS